jgi:hypothetical protein
MSSSVGAASLALGPDQTRGASPVRDNLNSGPQAENARTACQFFGGPANNIHTLTTPLVTSSSGGQMPAKEMSFGEFT